MLVGRQAETDTLRAALDGARRGEGGCLVMRGGPGVGRSALLHRLAEAAAGSTVLRTTGEESESALPFGGLASLLGPVLDHLGALPAAPAAALSAALALRPAGVSGGPETLSDAVRRLLDAAAGPAGLLAVVDDAQWLDGDSADVLRGVARGLARSRVLLVLAVRDGEPGADRFDDLPAVVLTGLPGADAAALLASALDEPAHPAVARALVEATGGNPTALLHAATALTPAQARGAEPLPDPVPVPAALARALTRPVAALSGPVRQALGVAAVAEATGAGAAADPQVVARALAAAGLSPDALDAAEAAGLVAVSSQGIRFRTPLLRAAVPAVAAAGDRRRWHAALAEALRGRGDASDRDRDRNGDRAEARLRRAHHLIAATPGPDEEAAAAVEAAALAARGPLGPGRALTLLRDAARLSPDPAERVRRLARAARLALPAGRGPEAVALLDVALAEVPAGDLRATLAECRDRLLLWGGDPGGARARLTTRAEVVAAPDPGRAVGLLVAVAEGALARGEPGAAVAAVSRAAALLGPDRPRDDLRLLEGWALALTGETGRAAALLNGGGGDGDGDGDGVIRAGSGSGDHLVHPPLALAGACALALGRAGQARALLGRTVRNAREGGEPGLLALPLAWLSAADLALGDWDAAEDEAREAVRLAAESGTTAVTPVYRAALARVEALRGRSAGAEHAAQVLDADGAAPAARVGAHEALGLLALGRGRPGEAVDALQRARDAALDAGLGAAADRLLPDLAEALDRGGYRDEAAALLDGGPGDGEEQLAAALRRHDEAGDPFGRARALLRLGERRRRRGARAAARDPLQEAAAVFRGLGAVDWLARAEAELGLTAGGPARSAAARAADRLTPQELRVARCVAEGRSNAEAAAALALSPRTVEAHLSSAYRKLGVRSRAELTRLVLAGQPLG